MRRLGQRLVRLEAQKQPASAQAGSEWRGIPVQNLIGFMTSDERSAYRKLLLTVRDHFHDLPQVEQEMVRDGMRGIMDVAAERVKAGIVPPVDRRLSIREVYEASLRSGARG